MEKLRVCRQKTRLTHSFPQDWRGSLLGVSPSSGSSQLFGPRRADNQRQVGIEYWRRVDNWRRGNDNSAKADSSRIDYLDVFGCLAHMHVTKDKREKLDLKSWPCILLGYSNDKFRYQMWDLADNKFLQIQDIVFMEDKTINTFLFRSGSIMHSTFRFPYVVTQF